MLTQVFGIYANIIYMKRKSKKIFINNVLINDYYACL